MLIYGSDPGWIWSDMNGLAPFLPGLVWFKLYWAAWAMLLAVVASLFWVRGRELGVVRRLALARQRLRGPTLRVAAVAVAAHRRVRRLHLLQHERPQQVPLHPTR